MTFAQHLPVILCLLLCGCQPDTDTKLGQALLHQQVADISAEIKSNARSLKDLATLNEQVKSLLANVTDNKLLITKNAEVIRANEQLLKTNEALLLRLAARETPDAKPHPQE